MKGLLLTGKPVVSMADGARVGNRGDRLVNTEEWRVATCRPPPIAATPSRSGLVHGLFVLLVGMSLLPSLHPRMASEQRGPTATRQLEPPGFLALHYGRRTPLSVLIAHVVYGMILGAFYRRQRR